MWRPPTPGALRRGQQKPGRRGASCPPHAPEGASLGPFLTSSSAQGSFPLSSAWLPAPATI